MVAKWWLSLIKIFSLTTGILSFLLVWFFYLDHDFFVGGKERLLASCSTENAFLLGFILFCTSMIYFLVMKSQVAFRHKELFFRKLYGETNKGIIGILMIETTIYVIIAFILSLILVDQVAPWFNIITEKNVNLQDSDSPLSFIIILIFLVILGFAVGILPSIWYAKNKAIDILKKLPH